MHEEPSSSLTGLRILVVDDEYLVAVHIETMLEDLGCTVIGPVSKIEDALSRLRTEQIDGALLDANLYGKSSAPIAAELQSRAIPFVVVTGYGQLTLETAAINDAPRLSKPFNAKEFQTTLTNTFCREIL